MPNKKKKSSVNSPKIQRFVPETRPDLTYAGFPSVIEVNSVYFDYIWCYATARPPLLLPPRQGISPVHIRGVPVPSWELISPIPMTASVRKQCYEPFDEIDLKKYGIPQDEVTARRLCRRAGHPTLADGYPLPNTALKVSQKSTHLFAVNFPRRISGLPVSVHNVLRERFHGIYPDMNHKDYGYSLKEATSTMFTSQIEFTEAEYAGRRFFRRLCYDKLHSHDFTHFEREKIFKVFLKDRDYYGLTAWQLLEVAPPVYVHALIEDQDVLFHPWLLLFSKTATECYMATEFGQKVYLPGTRKAWFTYAFDAAMSVYDECAVKDVVLPVVSKVVQTLPRKPGYDKLPELSLVRKIALTYSGFTILLDADGCADFIKFVCKWQITIPLTVYWFTSNVSTTLTHVTVADLDLLRAHRIKIRLTPAGPDVADDYIVEAATEMQFVDCVVARDVGLMNRVIDLKRTDLLLVGSPEMVLSQILEFDKGSGLPMVGRPRVGLDTSMV